MKKALKTLLKICGILGAVYAGLFAVFFFDLDGKAIFKFVEPTLVKHYDSMERRDPMTRPYGAKPTND
ncbi:MAG: hypothetical protein K5981_05270 [Clostridia bacterium]|jgi:hypothetical protein|nr:hypothetical protein [Clostridia bacterium]